ncbi:MAG: 1-deoxy-D-xylulose-5-phosphate reductoisomerase, partial [Candidatus Krumholzibacteria bacterium]|nr:1-deoxy-D-xylulose-5-phosphate reductoisomerase [Candidatus Krumholzibacteria bacterium]
MKRIVILGSTGSIGRSAVEIIERAAEDFEVVGLAAGRNVDELGRQLELFPRARFAMRDASALSLLIEENNSFRDRQIGYGMEAIEALIAETSPDLVINALVGISGLIPTLKALELECCVALANKESLVTAGELIAGIISKRPDLIIPVDSEHFSISRCLYGYSSDAVEITLTASGGPFYEREFSELQNVSIEEVLDHPTWKMGRKVTVDSAQLLNKGLEVIEAHWLFNFPYSAIKVVIHPQSFVHSIVRLRDGSLLAHIGPADMRLSIMNALYFPEIREFPWKSLELEEMGRIEFAPLRRDRFPAFRLALEAAEAGGTATAVLNAADEIAVEAFLAGKIG